MKLGYKKLESELTAQEIGFVAIANNLDDIISQMKTTNELLEKISDRISWISGER